MSETETEQLKQNIIQSLDHADEKVLRMVNAILEIEQEYDFWYDLPDEVKDDVEIALEQSEKGMGETHEEVLKKYF